ncbi:carbohydrate ABC transporter ATP-binding protein, CUT1 family [Desulforamulus reducens MI-1]|uniref:Carbohydrate ABC transporter ATP-binding protein, CUT1 family n=1 Tax=Desulforamulus reducens (strain ATCC BAA-1160 / DSM 100696 / MI-1) TaxID=349161 RepID=A4J6S6_DESRM|nr:ABC transporter ATP-binding protein [Desulforamulus reducens]ABO50779.1 carbohydrate ABC transporter ATP-binding protein, CUT1 family [Desulforamulus reducens MI-1]
MALLEVKGIRYVKRGRTILDIDAFSLEEGEVNALIGVNGAGKTSFMQILALLQEPTSGELYFKGELITKKNLFTLRHRMAFVFQQPLLLDMTVRQNIETGLRIRKVPKKYIHQRVNIWLEKLGINHLANGPVRFLSGGEAQRVSIARALALEPEILFLDEPFTGLDSPTRGQLLFDLVKLLHGTKIATLFVTHDYAEIPHLAHRLSVMDQGRIVQTGMPREVYDTPKNQTVVQLLQWLPIDIKNERKLMKCEGGSA